MNILLLTLAYFLFLIFKPGAKLNQINFEKFAPLLSMFSNSGLDMGALLESDILKNTNFFGIDMTKIAPILQVLATFLEKDESKGDKNNDAAKYLQDNKNGQKNEAEKNRPAFPLEPISDIADKKITYSLTKYLSQK